MSVPAAASYQQTVEQVAQLLGESRRVMCITGAGISADSGLPTYRGIGGLYDDAMTEDNLPIEVALSGEMMCQEPQVTWKYIHQIENACRGAAFNHGHEVLASWEQRVDEFCVLTQNIDGFHRAAGSTHLIEIHGNIHDIRCMRCIRSFRVTDYSTLSIPPLCDGCGAMMRPRVVLFGEMLPDHEVGQLQSFLNNGVDLVISIGTTSVFPYIAGPVLEAKRIGVPTVEINPGDSEVSAVVDHRLRERAIVALADIDRLLRE